LRRLGHAIAKRRITSSRSQDVIADEGGISERFLRAIERGSGNPSYLTLRAIAGALNASLEEIVREAR
jgi:transcriptional regulator with XRE-family HTH domain